MKGSKGYILLESLISLTILLIIVSSYVGVTLQMQKESQRRLSSLADYRALYTETRRCRLRSGELRNDQFEISLDQGLAIYRQGGIVIVKK